MKPQLLLAVVACSAAGAGCTPFPGSDLFSFAEAVTIGSSVQQRQTNCIDIPGNTGFPNTFGLGVVTTILTTQADEPRVTVSVSSGDGSDPSTGEWSNEDLAAGTPHRVTFPVGDGSIYTFTGRATGQSCIF